MSWITNSEVSCDAVKNQLFPTSYIWVRFWGRIIIIIIIRASSQKVNVAKWYIWIIFVFPTIIKSPVLDFFGHKKLQTAWWWSTVMILPQQCFLILAPFWVPTLLHQVNTIRHHRTTNVIAWQIYNFNNHNKFSQYIYVIFGRHTIPRAIMNTMK